MTIVHSIVFGDIEIDESTIYVFEQGIPGIRNVKRYAIIDLEDSPEFKWLQACDPPYLTMMMVNPNVIDDSYRVPLDDNQMKALDLTNPEDAFYMAFVVIPDNPQNMTANLLAPVVFNFNSMKGLQVMVDGTPDLLKVKVFKG